MSKMNMADLHFPPNNKRRDTIMRHTAQHARSEQATAATLSGDPLRGATPIDQPDKGGTFYAYFLSAKTPGAGESMVIDVKKNGVSVLTGTYTFNAAKAPPSPTQLILPVTPGTTVKTGDVITCDRTYVAGGSPAMTATLVRVEWGAGENG